MTCCDCDAVCTSTTGASPETVMVSAIEPSFISALTVAVNDVGSSTPFRSNVENPGNMNVTLYVPGTQVNDPVHALAVGDGGADLLDQRRTPDVYLHARKDGAGSVFHDPGDAALRPCGGWQQEKRQRRRHHEPCDSCANHRNLLSVYQRSGKGGICHAGRPRRTESIRR